MKRYVVLLIACVCIPITTWSQKAFSVQVGGGATSMSWLSFTLEARIQTFEKGSIVQSVAVSTGYGAPMFNATFLPLELHGIFFQGDGHLDLTLGANVEIKYKQPNGDGWKDLRSSPVNPTSSLSYRYEPVNGGFCFRFGLGAMYAVADNWVIPQVVMGVGWTF